MDKREEPLNTSCEDADFALCMEAYAAALGAAAEKELEQAALQGKAAEFPPELDQACRAMLQRPPKRKPALSAVLRIGIAAAVLIALLFSLATVGQAEEVHMDTSFASWSDDWLDVTVDRKPGPLPDVGVQVPENEIQEAMAEMKIPFYLYPSWVPEGYTPESITTNDFGMRREVHVILSNDEGTWLFVDIYVYRSVVKEPMGISKDAGDPEFYLSKGRTFCLFQNLNRYRAACSDEPYLVLIDCVEGKDTLKKIINSMGVSE